MKISAYIPCYNGAATLHRAIAGIKGQDRPVDEFYVVDNASIDESANVAKSAGVRVIRLEGGLGRGAARARAMEEAKHPLVVCCDASIMLPADFVSRAIRLFENEKVAAVSGRIAQENPRTAADRWRGRHLFRTEKRTERKEYAPFSTGGAMVRAAPVREAGGYNSALYHGEDTALGERLLGLGYKVIYDPELIYWEMISNDPAGVLERYWRWNRAQGRMTWQAYLKQIRYSLTVMIPEDMETADLGAAMISAISPHYQFWRDCFE